MIDLGFLKDRKFITFCIKFLLWFCIFYFSTLAVIGLSSPTGIYNAFVAQYLDYVSGLKHFIIFCVVKLLSIFNIAAAPGPQFSVGIVSGKAVIVAMSCVGYGVYSFWLAYVIATSASAKLKITWAVFGVAALFFINIIRIAGFLYTYNKGTLMPLGIDHHTWFNLAAYTIIFLLIYLYEARLSRQSKTKNID